LVWFPGSGSDPYLDQKFYPDPQLKPLRIHNTGNFLTILYHTIQLYSTGTILVQESESSSESASSSDEEETTRRPAAAVAAAAAAKGTSKPPGATGKSAGKVAAAPAAPKSNLDLLLDLDAPGLGLSLPALTPATSELGGPAAPAAAADAAPMWVATTAAELLNKAGGGGGN
jgi:hypothetical protein